MEIVRRKKKSSSEQLLDFIRKELIPVAAGQKNGTVVEISFHTRNGGVSNVKYSRHEKFEIV